MATNSCTIEKKQIIQSTVSAAYPSAVASHSKTKTDDPHEISYDFQRLVIGDKSELKRKHLFKKEISQCSQEVSDSSVTTKSVDKKTSCCLNCQLKQCGNGELYEMTMQLERMMLGPESKSIEDVTSCSSSHACESSRFVGDPWMETNGFQPSPALKNEDGAARYHAAFNREIDVSLEQSCVKSQTEERDQESTQGFHDEGKRIIVEFVADYNTTINSNITDGSMDVGSYEYDRLLLTHETRSTDESDKAYEQKYSIASRTDVSIQHERLLLSHEPRSNDDSDETAGKKHSFSKRKVDVSLQKLCHKIEKHSEVSVFTDDMNLKETIQKTCNLQIQNQQALSCIPKKTNFEFSSDSNSEKRDNSRPNLVALDPFKIDSASKSHVIEKDVNCPQLSDLTLSSSVTTYHHDNSFATSEDQSDAMKEKSIQALDGAARLLDNYQCSDLKLSGSFQGQHRQESNDELILMNFLPLLSTWSAEDVDLKGGGKMPPTLKSGGGRLRRSVRKLATQTSSLVSRKIFLK